MIFYYRRVTDMDHDSWIKNQKNKIELTTNDTIAVDSVMHDLNNSYCHEVDSSLETDCGYTYWSGNDCYAQFDVFRFRVDETMYVLSHFYVCKNGHVIVVAVELPNETMTDNEILEFSQNATQTYFVAEY